MEHDNYGQSTEEGVHGAAGSKCLDGLEAKLQAGWKGKGAALEKWKWPPVTLF